MEDKTRVGIIGYGEIGSSLAKVYQEKGLVPMIRDLNVNTIHGKIDILDICLPYGENFISTVNSYIDLYLPKLTIIHSTVPVGTTKQISRPVVHSPVRGVHPNLKEGIEKFAWHGEMKKMCDKYNIDFDVINKWTLSYNIGYMGLDMQNVVRPNLYPPENGIGGHCVIANTELLQKEFESKALDLIMEYANKEETK